MIENELINEYKYLKSRLLDLRELRANFLAVNTQIHN